MPDMSVTILVLSAIGLYFIFKEGFERAKRDKRLPIFESAGCACILGLIISIALIAYNLGTGKLKSYASLEHNKAIYTRIGSVEVMPGTEYAVTLREFRGLNLELNGEVFTCRLPKDPPPMFKTTGDINNPFEEFSLVTCKKH